MKRVTLSGDAKRIESARRRAVAEQTTPDAQFRLGLADDASAPGRLQSLDAVLAQLQGQLRLGGPMPSRHAMNER